MTAGGLKRDPGPRRSTARLAAVQALYEMEIAGISATDVLDGFLNERWNLSGQGRKKGEEDEETAGLAEPDGKLMNELVNGAAARKSELDRLIGAALSGGWTEARLETLLRAILRAGTFELLALADIPARAVISEYVDVAKAFYEGPETAMVNGVLDNLARRLRAGEMADGG
jgi:N utilization substance protein B